MKRGISILALTAASVLTIGTAAAQSSQYGSGSSTMQNAPGQPGQTQASPSTDTQSPSSTMSSDSQSTQQMQEQQQQKAKADNQKKSKTRADAGTVRQIQQALNDKGFQAGPVDGVVGPKTRSALQQFQQSQGIEGNGQLNQETMAALGVEAQTASASQPSQDQGQQQASLSDSDLVPDRTAGEETQNVDNPSTMTAGPGGTVTTPNAQTRESPLTPSQMSSENRQ